MTRHTHVLAAAATLATWLSAVPAVAQTASVVTVATTGSPSPVADTTWSKLGVPLNSPGGTIAFNGQIEGPGTLIHNANVACVADGAGVRVVLGAGTTLPGAPAATMSVGIESFTGGRFVIKGGYEDPLTQIDHVGLWEGPAGDLALRVLSDHPYDFGRFSTGGFGVMAANGGGQVEFASTMLEWTPAIFPNGLWTSSEGALSQTIGFVVGGNTGSPAPGTDAMFARVEAVQLTDGGQMLVEGMVQGATVTEANDVCLWTGSATNLSLVAREGGQAPGLVEPTLISWLQGRIYPEVLHQSGFLAFKAELALGPNVRQANRYVLLGGAPGAIGPLARGGDFVAEPAVPRFQNFYSLAVNAHGELAFRGVLVAENDITPLSDEAIYVGAVNHFRLVVREGDPAPGTPGGVVFDSFGLAYTGQYGTMFTLAEPLWLDDAGRLVFPARVRGTGVTEVNDMGYWAFVPGEGLLLIAREGEALPGGASGTRVVERMFVEGATGGAAGVLTAMSQAGVFAFQTRFTDGADAITVATLPSATPVVDPEVTQVSHAAGPSAGGTVVTIDGADFQPGVQVMFGTLAGRDVALTGTTRIEATTPPHWTDVVDIFVINPDGTNVKVPRAFRFTDPAPVIAAVTPATGPTAGGTRISITGAEFRDPTVTIGSEPLLDVVWEFYDLITATTPPHAAGPADIVVTNYDGQTATLAAGFTYGDGPQELADLIVQKVTAPAGAAPGQSLGVQDITKNLGPAAAGPSRTVYYLSADRALDNDDVEVGWRDVPTLAPGEVSAGPAPVTIPADAQGRLFLIARADGGGRVAERLETNNARPRPITIGVDLVVSALGVSKPVKPGQPATVTVKTGNLGPGPSGPTTTRIYLSEDNVLDAGDALLGERAVPALAVRGVDTGAVPVTIPADAAGRWYVLARADAAQALTETNEGNNTRAATLRLR